MKSPIFLYFETYGCTANQNNTEIMAGLVKQAGLELTNNEKIADILVINTCIVKGPTENKIKRRISDLLLLKKPIIIAGCMPGVRKKWLEDLELYLLDTSHTLDIAKLIKDIQNSQYAIDKYLDKKQEIKLNKPKIPKASKIGITQISEGCLGNCAYCITKFVKGNLFSYPQEEILKNISQDIESGCKEIWLTSQDNAAYGLDIGKNLINLLKKVLSLEGKFKIRLGMMNPENVLPLLDELIKVYQDNKLYKFLHIPLQSGSDRILKLMNRKYKAEDFLKIIKKFRKEIPEITISTDIIVGFPEETETDFQETINIIKKINLQFLNISKYWAMQGTLASEYNQVPVKISKSRALQLHECHKKLAEEKNKNLTGKQYKILITSYNKIKKEYSGRNQSYILIKIKSEENLIGKFVDCKIIKAFPYHLEAEIINKTRTAESSV